MRCWFAGLTTLDVIHRVGSYPNRNEKVTAEEQFLAAGGPAANAAIAASALGVEAALVTALGPAPAADLARADLRAHGVAAVDLARAHELSVSSIVVSPSGERAVVSTDAGTPQFGPLDLSHLPTPRAVLLDGHHPAIQRAAITEAKARGALIILDAGRWRPIFAELIPRADVVACSADFTLPGGPARSDENLAAELLGRGAGAVVITHGGDPVYWSDGKRGGHAPVPAVPARDTLGAGDVFHGALTAALARDPGDLPTAVREGIRAASTRVQHVGPRSYLADARFA